MPNGTIRTLHQLDRETISTYGLVVAARDCAKEPEKRLSSTVQVRVQRNYFSFFAAIHLATMFGSIN